MAQITDWLPRRRQDTLSLARTWVSVFREDTTDSKGQTTQKYTAWGIPAETFTEFTLVFAKAEETLRTAQEKETRTEVTNAICRTAFEALIAAMRAIKKRWLLVPPLTEADIIALGLKMPDRKSAPSGAPTARVIPEIIRRGLASLTLRFAYVDGNAGDPANKNRRLWYKVIPPGAAPPDVPEELSKSVPMNRKTETLVLNYGDSGKKIYMAARLENGDYEGPFGPMISAIIP